MDMINFPNINFSVIGQTSGYIDKDVLVMFVRCRKCNKKWLQRETYEEDRNPEIAKTMLAEFLKHEEVCLKNDEAII